MNVSLAVAISAAVFRAVAALLGALVLCACILGAVGFALVALYTYLAPALGPMPAAFATSSAALIVPALVTAGILIAARIGADDRLPIMARTTKPAAKPAFDWIAENPRAATLGALGLGVAPGASPELRKSLLQGFEQATVR